MNDILKTITGDAHNAIYIKDRSGRYIFCNFAAAEFIGKHVDEVIGRTDMELFPPEQAQVLMRHDQQIMKSGETSIYDVKLTTWSGLRTFKSSKTPYRNDAGHIIGVVGISRDITSNASGI